MAFGISEKLRARARGKQESAEVRYRKLVFASARTGKADVVELGDASEALGLDADAVDAHLAVVARYDSLAASVADYIGKESELTAAANVQAELDDLNRRRLALLARREEALAKLNMLAATNGELARIRNDNPSLFAAK
jgi:hypothetical protein